MLKDLASDENMSKLQKLGTLAKEIGLELSQLVLAYTLTLPGMGPVIPAASSVKQLESNARVGQIELTGDQIQAVHRILTSSN
jgi:aryl-alcohol dehydrogenase-like predicted oxidoreductase